jgi:predicted dehydrogenase
VSRIKRREFIKASSAFAGIQLLPSLARAQSPNRKIGVAQIGIGGMGTRDLATVAGHPMVEIVGLCDVDRTRLDKVAGKHPQATCYQDYREMLSALGDKLDAVVVSTPDHTHAPAAMAAMEGKKHIYCQKPLTHDIAESYQMAALAREYQLTTQMGIQIHSGISYRTAVEAVRSGVIGKISKVYVWSGKDWGYDGPPYEGSDPVPETLDWNLWLGTAPERPYLEGKYHPNNWRKILDFGCGTLGDMGVHIFDTPIKALELGFATSVKTTCREPNGFSHPNANVIEYTFNGTRHTTNEITFTWFDGKASPAKAGTTNPDLQLPDDRKLPGQGAMFIGEEGKRILLPHVGGPQFLPRELTEAFEKPKLEPIDHYHLWVDSILGKAECNAGFDYAHLLTTNVLLGVVGSHFPGKLLEWDGGKMRFTNHEAANKYVTRDYRPGFAPNGESSWISDAIDWMKTRF